jgi:DNA topoisomerase-2
MNNITLSDFLSNQYVDFSSYDLVRKIASVADGQKNASRKILHTVREQNINSFLKVSNLGPKVQDFTQYLHGSLEGTIVNVTADYVGSGNNIPLLEGDGNFGSSFIPTPAASRYIFARQNEIIKNIFLKEDSVLLEEQWFEGDKIEPKYYVPTIPMLAINGSEGISIGFAQKILPRNPKEVIKWVKQRSAGQRITADLKPYWNGMTCTVEQGESPNQWIIKGSFERKTKTQLIITSIPVGYSLKQYQSVLDKLVDDKVIRNYDDLSDNDEFQFDVSVDRNFGSQDDEWILNKLKLIKTVSENYTCIDTNNKIVQYESIYDILIAWFDIRMNYNQKRKDYIIKTLENDNNDMRLKRIFIQGVVDGAIELRNASEEQVMKDTIAYNNELNERVNSLMNLPMRVLTKEEIKKLDAKIKENEIEIENWKSKTIEQISLEDVKKLESVL